MPLIKVTSSDGKITKLCAAKDIVGLKEKGNRTILELTFNFLRTRHKHFKSLIVSNILAEEKLGFSIDKFVRKEDGLEVEDDVVLQELIKSEKEVWLIAKKISGSSNRKNGVAQIAKVSTLNQKEPSSFDANSLKLLKMQGK